MGEKMCEPMMARMQAVLDAVKAEMGISVDQIDFVEMVGGAHRVPFVKKMCSDTFGGKDLSFTMNAEESVCRGCALQAAMLSPLFKVRDFRVEDRVPSSITFTWQGSGADTADKDGDEEMADAEASSTKEKQMAVFDFKKDKMDTRKYVTWKRDAPFSFQVGYTGATT